MTWEDMNNNHRIYYITQSGDIDQAGVWCLQAYIEMPSFKGYGEIKTLSVKEHL